MRSLQFILIEWYTLLLHVYTVRIYFLQYGTKIKPSGNLAIKLGEIQMKLGDITEIVLGEAMEFGDWNIAMERSTIFNR